VHDNLCLLGLDVLDVVNLRTAAGIDERVVFSGTLTRQFEALSEPPSVPRTGSALR